MAEDNTKINHFVSKCRKYRVTLIGHVLIVLKSPVRTCTMNNRNTKNLFWNNANVDLRLYLPRKSLTTEEKSEYNTPFISLRRVRRVLYKNEGTSSQPRCRTLFPSSGSELMGFDNEMSYSNTPYVIKLSFCIFAWEFYEMTVPAALIFLPSFIRSCIRCRCVLCKGCLVFNVLHWWQSSGRVPRPGPSGAIL